LSAVEMILIAARTSSTKVQCLQSILQNLQWGDA